MQLTTDMAVDTYSSYDRPLDNGYLKVSTTRLLPNVIPAITFLTIIITMMLTTHYSCSVVTSFLTDPPPSEHHSAGSPLVGKFLLLSVAIYITTMFMWRCTGGQYSRLKHHRHHCHLYASSSNKDIPLSEFEVGGENFNTCDCFTDSDYESSDGEEAISRAAITKGVGKVTSDASQLVSNLQWDVPTSFVVFLLYTAILTGSTVYRWLVIPWKVSQKVIWVPHNFIKSFRTPNNTRVSRKRNLHIVTQRGSKLGSASEPEDEGEDANNNTESNENGKSYNTRFTLLKCLPLRALSQTWGKFHSRPLPRWLITKCIHLFCDLYGANLSEAESPEPTTYVSMQDFFRRAIKPGIRPVSQSHGVTSPADGRILYLGPVKDGVLEQVKGVYYSLRGFLGPQNALFDDVIPPASLSPSRGMSRLENSCHNLVQYGRGDNKPISRLDSCHDMVQYGRGKDQSHNSQNLMSRSHSLNSMEDTDQHLVPPGDVRGHIGDRELAKRLITQPGNQLYHCIIYLAPGDYHRFHNAADWSVMARRHFPGELFSVSPNTARWLQGLFNFNERALYMGRWRHGFFSYTAVGATNVGSIKVYCDQELETNTPTYTPGTFHDSTLSHEGLPLAKGDLFGEFNLGSTIVLLFEAPPSFKFEVKPGKKVKVGQGLGYCHDDDDSAE